MRGARLLACAAAALLACGHALADSVCAPAWQRSVEAQLGSGDGQGHGPDLGSDEWQAVVEARLGLRGTAALPARDSTAWCTLIAQQLAQRPDKAGATATVPPACRAKNRPGSIAELVCGDAELRALDLKMAEVYAAALRLTGKQHPPLLKAEQRGWIKGRDDCWKAGDEGRLACVHQSYQLRIAELQARYRLLPVRATARYACSPGHAADEVLAFYFDTEPPSLIAERGDQVSLMFLQRSASGARYEGRNESLWEHQGEALVRWGYGAPELRCRLEPAR